MLVSLIVLPLTTYGSLAIQGEMNLNIDLTQIACDVSFIAGRGGECLVVTGPNMGGKSSTVRMVALVCIMGQVGAGCVWHITSPHLMRSCNR